jgi:uncharacterized protein YjbJ (UPF0337 family)
MNEDVIKGQWKEIRGKAKEWWGALTDDDLKAVNGRRDRLIGKLQEKYGYTKEEAMQQIEQRLSELQHAIPLGR